MSNKQNDLINEEIEGKMEDLADYNESLKYALDDLELNVMNIKKLRLDIENEKSAIKNLMERE